MSSHIQKQLDEILDRYIEDDALNFTLLVYKEEEILFDRTHGLESPQSNKKLTKNSIFNLASVTKPFMTLCILQQRERGAVQYDDDIRKWLPDLPYSGITLRHLMTHTSGLPEYFQFYKSYFPEDKVLRNHDLLDIFIQAKPHLNFQPGEIFDYCNTGYILLALIIEKVSGLPVTEYFVKNILEPACMNNAYPFTFDLNNMDRDRVQSYEIKEGEYCPRNYGNIDGVFGDGNLCASRDDVRKWIDALGEGTLVNSETIDEAFLPYKLNDGTFSNYGLGWRLNRDLGFAWHSGSWLGFRNHIRFGKKNQPKVIFLSNSSFSERDALVFEINKLISLYCD